MDGGIQEGYYSELDGDGRVKEKGPTDNDAITIRLAINYRFVLLLLLMSLLFDRWSSSGGMTTVIAFNAIKSA